MNNKLVLASLVTVASICGFAGQASANDASYAVNSYSTRHIYNGYSELSVKNVSVDVSKYTTTTQTAKFEADKGNFNEASVSFDGKNLTGYAYSSNRVPQDPVVIGSVTQSTTTGVKVDYTTSTLKQKYNFSGTDYTHTVETGTR